MQGKDNIEEYSVNILLVLTVVVAFFQMTKFGKIAIWQIATDILIVIIKAQRWNFLQRGEGG